MGKLKEYFLKLKKFVIHKNLWLTLGGISLTLSATILFFKTDKIYQAKSFLEEYKQENKTYKLSSPEPNFDKGFEYIVEETPFNYSVFSSVIINVPFDSYEADLKLLKEKGVLIDREFSHFKNFKTRPAIWLLILSLIFFCMVMLISFNHGFSSNGNRKMRTINYQNENGDQSKTEEVDPDMVRFEDVAGIDEVKDQIQEIVELFKDSSKISAMGGKIPKGIILNGPPGTGKTMLARATANECNANFLSATGSEFVEMYVGVGAKRVRDLFRKANSMAPCILFIDEIDAVGGRRGVDHNSEREQTLNQILTEMDGFSGLENVLVFAATNQIEKIDPALLRPGRFDRQIYVNLPDVNGREQILNVYIKKAQADSTVSVSLIAKMTAGFSGADLANLVNEAILYAARSKRDQVAQSDFLWARDKIIMGSPRKLKVDPIERKQTAYHEIGHAYICHKLEVSKLVNISIIPRGKALGVTQIEGEDLLTLSRHKAIQQLAMLLGGRVAERIFFEDHRSTGASNDLQRVYSLTHSMITQWGMSDDLGPLGLESKHYEMLSEETKRTIDLEVRKTIKEAEALATNILLKDRDLVAFLSEQLLLKEDLSINEFNQLIEQFNGEQRRS